MSDTTLASSTDAFESVLREAGRQRRRVRVRFRYEGESGPTEYERSWEPYSIEDGAVTVYSSLMNGFRAVALRDITSVELLDETFSPRIDITL